MPSIVWYRYLLKVFETFTNVVDTTLCLPSFASADFFLLDTSNRIPSLPSIVRLAGHHRRLHVALNLQRTWRSSYYQTHLLDTHSYFVIHSFRCFVHACVSPVRLECTVLTITSQCTTPRCGCGFGLGHCRIDLRGYVSRVRGPWNGAPASLSKGLPNATTEAVFCAMSEVHLMASLHQVSTRISLFIRLGTILKFSTSLHPTFRNLHSPPPLP
jgi:hypothetical protein